MFGIVFTELCGLPLEAEGGPEPHAHLWVNAPLAAALLLGAALTALIPSTLHRQAAQLGGHLGAQRQRLEKDKERQNEAQS